MNSAENRNDLSAKDPLKGRMLERSLVETVLPAHLMFLTIEECERRGWRFRADIKHRLNVATVASLQGLDPVARNRVARKVDDVATALLRETNFDDPRHTLYCCAMFILKLVDEGLYADGKNVAVLTSLLLMDDAKEEDSEWGLGVYQSRLKNTAADTLRRVQLLGLYPVLVIG